MTTSLKDELYNKEIEIDRDDILKSIYFIISITQKQKGHAMHGAFNSKGDLMGGIFDRWVNTIPESIIFNKIILPKLSKKNVEIVSDFYSYDPVIAGIAPDVIGIKVDSKVIPFVNFKEKWCTIDNKPQIEIKTFKKTQKMISLRNQGYDNKYLIMAESEFYTDYLLRFFHPNFFKDTTYNEMTMDNKSFIISNKEKKISDFSPIVMESTSIGKLKLLKITKSDIFMQNSTKCEGSVGIQYINSINEKENVRNVTDTPKCLTEYVHLHSNGLYRFNDNWYTKIEKGIPYLGNKKTRTLDLFLDNPNAISIVKRNKSNIYIKTSNNVHINEYELKANTIYKIDFSILDRDSNEKDEFFMQKSLLNFIPDYTDNLCNKLKDIIEHT